MSTAEPKRVCQIIKLKPYAEAAYFSLHRAVWPGVLTVLSRHHITDYSIHYHAPSHLLISHFKYTGADYAADMVAIAQDPETRRWWAVTDAMQESLVDGASGSGGDIPWWLDLPEVFRTD